MTSLQHPLAVGTQVEASRPRCSCVGGGFIPISGQIQKVIQNHMGTWYFLSSGVTIKADWIKRVL